MFDLRGRVALVTGAGQGVGAAIAMRLAERGATVAINDISEPRAAETAKAIDAAGGQAVAVVADVAIRDQIVQSVGLVASDLGPIDVLVNNAGLPPSGFRVGAFADSAPEDWEPYISINLYGVMHCTHAVLHSMMERRWGRIVTIVSDAGRFGEPGMAAYAAAKAGAAGFVRSVAKEVGPYGITCNCLSLGSIEPPGGDKSAVAKQILRYPMRRLGQPDDVAAAVVWMASEQASWVTGQTVSVNGGYMTA